MKPRVNTSREVLAHVDGSKPVRVYRNLHKNCVSVKQGGIVRCHAENVTLKDCKFIVSLAGQRRVRDEKKKNVHSFVEGYVFDSRKADKIVDGTNIITHTQQSIGNCPTFLTMNTWTQPIIVTYGVIKFFQKF